MHPSDAVTVTRLSVRSIVCQAHSNKSRSVVHTMAALHRTLSLEAGHPFKLGDIFCLYLVLLAGLLLRLGSLSAKAAAQASADVPFGSRGSTSFATAACKAALPPW